MKSFPIKPWRLDRRAFLRGAGVAVALPLLEAMLPIGRNAFAQTSLPSRFLAYYVPNGMHMPSWTPAQDGKDFVLSKTLAPLINVKNDLLVLSNLANRPGQPDQIGDHASGTGSFMTAVHVRKSESDIYNGISVDQVAAKKISQENRFSSLEVGMDGGGSAGGCDSGYSCAYTRNIAWAAPKTPLPKITSPRILFDRLFSGFNSNETAEEAEKRRVYNLSILDYVMEDTRKLQQKLGTDDRAKLQEYMGSIEILEKKLSTASNSSSCTLPQRPELDSQYTLTQKAQLMADLMVMAFQCDITRVQSFMLANAASERRYDFLDIDEGHHTISHHQNLQSNYDKLEKINYWEIQQLAYLLEKLKSTRDIQGNSLLDSSLVFFSSEISDGNWHNHYNLPVILAGNTNNYFDTGRHIRYSTEKPIANLFMSILDAVGAPAAQFGDNSTGLLEGLIKSA
jgi:Protein of unknown function (DUF1552)